MAKNTPTLSIGLPVFNGEKYLRQAIDSILSQEYRDFRLIISDNASTDKTEDICREFLRKDKRVEYYRSEKNKGAAWNWNHVFELSSGVYFKWAAHDDIYDPQYLVKCIGRLEEDPSIILCHSKNALIDENGKIIGKYEPATFKDSKRPHERFSEVMNKKGFPTLAWLIFGVFRRDALKPTQLYGRFIDADWNFLAEVSLIGRIFEVPEYLFLRRKHEESYAETYYDSTTGQVRDYRTQSLWWTGSKRRPLLISPTLRSFLEFFRSTNRIRMSYSERWLCYKEICLWFYRRGWKDLKSEVGNELDYWRIRINYGKMENKTFISSKRF